MSHRFHPVAFQIYLICKMLPPNGVRRGLEASPDTLKAAYGEIYPRVYSWPGASTSIGRSYESILCSETLLDVVTVDEGGFSRKDTVTDI